MRIIFLDFDGVLNHREHFENLRAGRTMADVLDDDESFDKACVERANVICERTGAKVVVSTSWRCVYNLTEIREVLRRHGFRGEVIDATPRLHRTPNSEGRVRGDEIQEWLYLHPEVTSFVILDDDSDMRHLIRRLVKTSFDHGLQDEHVERAVVMLSEVVR